MKLRKSDKRNCTMEAKEASKDMKSCRSFLAFVFCEVARLISLTKERTKNMCEANAYLIRDGKEELIMESVDILRPEGARVYIQDIFGAQRWVSGHIGEMNLVEHRIVLLED
jgi:predicted RNA-binding protein